MKKHYAFYLLFFAISTAIFLMSGVDYSSGSPGGKTGSPGDSGNTCTQCHAGTAEPAEGLISSDIPGQGFIPGETYEIQVSFTDENAGLFGFEVTAENSADAKTGTFTLTDEENTQFVNANAAVSHTNSGTTPVDNSKTWTMQWTAPEEPEGPVTFYTAVNAADGNGTNSGDQIYTSSETYQINSVGIAEQEIVEKLYPNPVRDMLHITLENANEKVHIWSASGKLLNSKQVKSHQISIDVSQYAEGVYFLSVEGYKAKRFIIQR